MMQPRHTSKRAAGFSLVELILALALGLVVVTGIVQLFVGNSQTYAVLNGQARMQENARFAMEFISRAARSAGYFGCAPERPNIVRGLMGTWDTIPEFDITRMVQGYEGGGGGWSPAITSVPRTVGGTNTNVYIPGNGINTNVIVPGTDVLVFRSKQLPGQRLVETLQPDGNPVVTAPGGNPGFGVGDIVMVADCEQGAVFRVTAMTVNGNEATLRYDTFGGGLYDNGAIIESPTGSVPFTLSYLGRSYGPDTTVAALQSTYFFVAPGAGVDNQLNPVPSLWQKLGSAAPVELVQGVEDLQVLYGIDTTLNDRVANANQYVTFNNLPNPNDPDNVVSVRVSLTVNSIDAVTDDGQVLRRTFSKTILLRNADPEV
ncbi:MAG: PilW family protein [Pseudomonadales bacterium]